ncbi:50S ribosomal protein L27 [Candidatus Nomurabacteria bacterium]|nr:50S ribosomal protein L27 [Candidatus Nomurabacteria bacterium]
MSHVKAGGTAKNLKDSKPKFLGTKLYAGQKAKAGSVIVRQRGSRILAGKNVSMGKDHTLFATKAGVVSFSESKKKNYNGQISKKKVVNVVTK